MPHASDQVTILDFPGVRVAALAHRGDPASIGDSIDTFIAWRKQARLVPPDSATFNIVHAAPDPADPDRFHIDLCAVTDRTVGENPFGIVEKTIPAGRCAVLRHVGPEHGVDAAVRHLVATWLPQSGEVRRDFPIFFQRLHVGPGVGANRANAVDSANTADSAETDIFLPLK
jgi:AraC family transcriptional regulator